MNEIVVEGAVALTVPDETRRTIETPEHGPITYRFFSGVVVSALTLIRPGNSTGRLAGGVVGAYSPRAGFSRTSLRDLAVPGSETATEFDMHWTSSSGDEITSLVRVAKTAEVAVLLHVSCPTLLVDDAAIMRGIAESLRIMDPSQ